MPKEKEPKIARVAFTITSENGTVMYMEGQAVPSEIAEKFPYFIVGWVEPKPKPHNPDLPIKLSKTAAGKMEERQIVAWFEQYHPGKLPPDNLNKEQLIALAMELQEA